MFEQQYQQYMPNYTPYAPYNAYRQVGQPIYQPTTTSPFMPQSQGQQSQKANMFFYVNGVEGAKAFYLEPNSTVLLMDSENKKFYWKSTDSQGKAEITEHTYIDDSEKKKMQNYVSVEDFEALKKEVQDLKTVKKIVNKE